MAPILVIDDEPDLRTFVELVLQSVGHEVTLAADGKEGMERHRTSPADLVITDLYMPNQDGVETIRELRSCFPEVAIIAMSGRAVASTLLTISQKLGAVGVLQKPFTADELIAAVGKTLG
jgi:CheY-like chemotaxis protein